ncbi:MAG: twin-arginine translocase subunit TatC [Balneolaceae bacterium]|nr:twin-arginine translocase subunit TatC [Balneolaceae bacterium]
MKGDPPKAEPPPHPTDQMSFLDHLEELRWRIIKGSIGIVIGIGIAFIFSDFLINTVLLGPTKADFVVYQWLGIDAIDLTLQSRKLPGQFFAYWGTLFVMGIIIGAPLFIYQLWGFVEPAFDKAGKWRTRGNTLFITFFFLLGVCFGYFVLVPFALQFFSQFQISDVIRNDFDINAYFSSVSMWILSCGVIFQLPVVSYFLSKFGLITPDFLKKYRRHSLVGCFVISAVLTPPDPVSQILVAVPLILLYQLSIFVSKLGVRSREKSLKKAFGDA